MANMLIVVEPDGTFRTEDIGKRKAELKVLQKLVHGLIEGAGCLTEKDGSGIDLWVNEEGFIDGMEENKVASRFASCIRATENDAPYREYTLFGPLVIARFDANGDSFALTENYVEFLRYALTHLGGVEVKETEAKVEA